jgi:hypothetical protein
MCTAVQKVSAAVSPSHRFPSSRAHGRMAVAIKTCADVLCRTQLARTRVAISIRQQSEKRPAYLLNSAGVAWPSVFAGGGAVMARLARWRCWLRVSLVRGQLRFKVTRALPPAAAAADVPLRESTAVGDIARQRVQRMHMCGTCDYSCIQGLVQCKE